MGQERLASTQVFQVLPRVGMANPRYDKGMMGSPYD